MRMSKGACRKFLALTARRAWRWTLPSVVGGRPMILSAIDEPLKPITHRLSAPIAELLVSAIWRLSRLLRSAGLNTLYLSPVGQFHRHRRNPLLAREAG